MTRTRTVASLLAPAMMVAATASAQVTPITPSDLTSTTAVTETFEGVVGVSLAQKVLSSGSTIPQGEPALGFSFPTGVRLAAKANNFPHQLFDWSVPSTIPNISYPLGTNGSVSSPTPLPSGTSFLAYFGDWYTLRLPVLAGKVGLYIETADAVPATITLFDDNGATIGSHSIPTTDGASNTDGINTFIGAASSVPIRSVRIDGGMGVIDDFMFDPCNGAVHPYGAGCPGTGGHVPVLAMGGCPEEGQQVSLEISDGLGGSSAILLFGLGQGATPVGASGCDLLVAPVIGPALTLPLTPGGPGQGSLFLPGLIPGGTAGASFTMQVWVIDPASSAGAAASNGIEVTIG